MSFFRGLIQLMLLGVALGANCGNPSASCKSILSDHSVSASCSKILQLHSKSITFPSCTKTVTKPAPTSTKYTRRGKTTLIQQKVSIVTVTVHLASRDLATIRTTKTKVLSKTSYAICTELSTVRKSSTRYCTTTRIVTRTTTVIVGNTGNSLKLRLKRNIYSLPKPCSCFATKTKTSTKTPGLKTKTVAIPTSTILIYSTKRQTLTKTYATARTLRYSTITLKITSTHYKITTKVIKITSTSIRDSTHAVTSTRWVTKTVTAKTALITSVGTKAYTTTKFPRQSTGVVTIIIYKKQPVTTITRIATGIGASTTTIFPKNDNGQTISDVSHTITILKYVILPVVSKTSIAVGGKAYTTTLFPSSGGVALTNGQGTKTVIIYIVEAVATITRIAMAGSTPYTTTVFPTDSDGQTISDGSGTKTVIVYVPESIVTVTSTNADVNSIFTTIIPPMRGGTPITDGSVPETAVVYVPESVVTVTSAATGTDASVYTTTQLPTDNNGNVIIGTKTVIIYIPQPIITVTSTDAAVSSAFTTTVSSGNGSPPLTSGLGTKTVVVFVPQAITTITRVDTSKTNIFTSTLFPTDRNGHTITDGTGTQTAVVYLPEAVTRITRVAPPGISFNYITTLFPTDSSGRTVTDRPGTVLIIEYVTLPTTYVTEIASGTVGYETTIYPTDASGHTIVSGIVSVIEFRRVVTITSIASVGSAAHLTTLSPVPSNHLGAITVIRYITRPVVTATNIAGGSSPSATTVYPPVADPSGVISIITYKVRSTKTILTAAESGITSAITIFPPSTDVINPVTVIEYLTGGTFINTHRFSGTTTTTLTFPAGTGGPSETTEYPASGGTGGATIIKYLVRPTTTIFSPASHGIASTTTILPVSTVVGTVTVIDFVLLVTQFVPTTGIAASLTTVPPTDPSGLPTIIEYVPLARVTITRVGLRPFKTTVYPTGSDSLPIISFPTNSAGQPLTRYQTDNAGNIIRNSDVPVISVIDFEKQPVITVFVVTNSASITTVYPTDSNGSTVVDISATISVIEYITQPTQVTTTITKVGSSPYLSTIFPTDSSGSILTNSGSATVIDVILQPITTILTLANGTGPSTMTLYPTDDAGATITDGSGTITVIDYENQPITSFLAFTNQPYTTTLYPTDSLGHTLRDASDTITIIYYITTPIKTLTRTDITAHSTTIFPASNIPSPTISVVVYVSQPRVTVTRIGPSVYTSTAFPVDSLGSIVSHSGTVTVIDFTTEAITTVTEFSSATGLTTIFPTDSTGRTIISGGTISVITFAPKLITTITEVGPSSFVTTKYPTDTAGHIITDGSVQITVIDFIPQLVVTATRVGLSAYTTTILANPTDISGTISVIDYVTRPVTTVRSLASVASTTTILPASTDITATITVIQYFTQQITTLTSVGTSAFTITLFPTDDAGHTITDGTGTITVVDVEARPTITTTELGMTAYLTTIFPADPTAAVSVIQFVTQPETLITRVASTTGLTTLFPTNSVGSTLTDGLGTLTIVTYIIQPIITVTRIGPSQFTTTISPTDSSGHTITAGSETITVIDYNTPVFTTVTSIGTTPSTTTIFPNPTDTTGVATIIDFITQPVTTVTEFITAGPITTPYNTTIFPSPTDILGTVTVIDFILPAATPDTSCENAGMQVAIYDNPFTNITSNMIVNWNFEYFGTVQPYNQNATDTLGFHWATSGSNSVALSPYGFSVDQGNATSPVYVLNYRGYFYAPKTQTYIVNVYNVESIVGLWFGETAINKWSKSNANITDTYDPSIGSSPTKNFQIELSAGTYTPFRIILGAIGGPVHYDVDIVGSDNVYYVKSTTSSQYLVQTLCNDVTNVGFSNYGDEFPLPDTSCSNIGLEVDVYDNPFTDVPNTSPPINIGGWTPLYFNNALPTALNTTTVLGFDSSNITHPYGFYRPTGVYALMHRGYFYAPFDSTYIFTISNVDDILDIWIGNHSYSNWTNVNPDISSQYCTYCTGSAAYPTTNKSIFITAGSYLAIRVLYGNGGGGGMFTFEITDQDGFYYLKHGVPSVYLVLQDCEADDAPLFPPLLPSTSCSNVGLDVGIYANPFVAGATLNFTSYNPEYFSTQIPYGTENSNIVGFIASGSKPQGFTPTTANVYAIQYRGYFFAPRTALYTFNVSSVHDILLIWTGDNAYTGFTKQNADAIALRNGTTTGSFQMIYNITAGTLFPFRLQFADGGGGGGFDFNIKDDIGILYVKDYTASNYLVAFGCDGIVPSFPDWGAETLLPDSCNNGGLNVALYGDPFNDSTANNTAFTPEYFKTQQPPSSTIAPSVGIVWSSSGANTAALNPYGMVPAIVANITLNYKGYFFAPKTSTYTFTIKNADNIAIFWLGKNAYANWDRANANGTSTLTKASPLTYSSGSVEIYLVAGSYTPIRIMAASWSGPFQYDFTVADADGVYYIQTAVDCPYLVQQACDVSATPMFPPFGSENNLNPTVTINSLAPSTAYSAHATTIFPTDSAGHTITDSSGTVTVIKYNTQAFATITLGGSNNTVDVYSTLFPTDSGGKTITDGSATATVVEYLPPSIPTSTYGPQFNCSVYAYIMIGVGFYQLDLTTGKQTLLNAKVDGANAANAMGYNVLDNYVYAMEGSGVILRIAANGKTTRFGRVGTPGACPAGDIDGQGQYWVFCAGATSNTVRWYQINLNPGTPKYGAIVAAGTTTAPATSFADWAYIPAAGEYMWALGINSAGRGVLTRFNLSTKKFEYLTTFSTFSSATLGGFFATNSGDLYGFDNTTGQIFKVNVFTRGIPTLVSRSNTNANIDGARCVFNNQRV
ncbi:hypothetical protein TWF694_004441 [Orbilia ellipsospora]|uniref:PA14 domain-containing protein n=1 Tax=Orbilia ellipsospora TaxID=2528407 RepID=A0AAV9WWJ3_9PEZI